MPDRDRTNPPSQSQQQAAPAAATAGMPTPAPLAPVGPSANIPTETPPAPTTYETMGCVWWGQESEVHLSAGQNMDFPSGGINSPPAHGCGIVRVQTIFAFDIISGSVTTYIGTSGSSEVNRPLKPYVGVSYPNETCVLHEGQRVHLHRVDIIDPTGDAMTGPADLRSWSMNKNPNGGSGRDAYPKLCPTVTAVTDAVLNNIQVESFATKI